MEGQRIEKQRYNHYKKSKTGLNLIFALAIAMIFICFLALQFWF